MIVQKLFNRQLAPINPNRKAFCDKGCLVLFNHIDISEIDAGFYLGMQWLDRNTSAAPDF